MHKLTLYAAMTMVLGLAACVEAPAPLAPPPSPATLPPPPPAPPGAPVAPTPPPDYMHRG